MSMLNELEQITWRVVESSSLKDFKSRIYKHLVGMI